MQVTVDILSIPYTMFWFKLESINVMFWHEFRVVLKRSFLNSLDAWSAVTLISIILSTPITAWLLCKMFLGVSL